MWESETHFSYYCRASGGRLHLVPGIGKIPLADAILIEDPSDDGEYDNGTFIVNIRVECYFILNI